MKNKLSKYVITIIIGLVIVALAAHLQNVSSAEGIGEITKLLSNSFLACAVIYLAVAGLQFVSMLGTFDILRYSAKKFFTLFKKDMRDEKLPPSFYDYVESLGKRRFNCWHYLFVGAASLVVAVIFTVIALNM